MKNLTLTLLTLAAFLFAAPALAEQRRVLLAQTVVNNTLASAGDLGECFAFGTEYYITTGCTHQYGAWIVPRNATITELSVHVVVNSGDMTGHCALKVMGDDELDGAFDDQKGVDYYFAATGSTPAGTVNRKAVDLDVTRGEMVGFTINNWSGIPSQCNSETVDPVLQLYVWGYYTD